MELAGVVLSTGISSSVLQPLVDRIIAALLSKFGKGRDYEDKLLKLEAKMLKLQCLVDDLENKPVSRCCGILVEKMRHILLNVDDLFNCIEARVGASDTNYIDRNLKEQVTDMLDTLNYWCQEVEPLFMSERAKVSSQQTLHITGSCSIIDESRVIGREAEKVKVIRWLFESQKEDDLGVISLVGMPGIGKTTVAQVVYNDPKVVSKFVLRMWVHVSKDYDVVKIMKSMLECATNKVCNLSHQNAIGNQVKLVLKKKFLLVLDDVCNEALHYWDDFKLLFRFAHPGSRVIITTRSKTVSSIVTSNSLDILSHNDCWGIIKHSLRTNVEQRQDLKEIGKKLGENCKRVPLAAKVIGDYLCIKSDQREWEDLLNCDLLNLAGGNNNLYNVLKLSYDHLPADLKPCFTYCSVIPQCHRVKEEDLIQMWAAQGFIRAQGARRIEDIGKEYFNELRLRYLLQKSPTGEVELHDFIHDLARLVSTNFCLCLDDKSCFLNVSSTVRHVCLLVYQSCNEGLFEDLFKKCGTLKKLRTFKFVFHPGQPPRSIRESVLFDNLLKSFQLLRVLDLSDSGILSLSKLVGNNTNLHYLNLSGTRIQSLPDSVCNLIGLETLKLLDCPHFGQWPSNFEKLIKLRHLDYPKQSNLNMPRALGKLTRLETLHTFVVKSEEGYEIGELEDMNCICGSILIRGLENVTNFEQAKAAMLENKKFLDKLELQWDQQREPTDQTKRVDHLVLQHLKPHSRLTELEIKGYHGVSLPDWLVNASCKLEKLVINSCVELVDLPSLRDLTSLKKLEIHGCPKLVSLPPSGLSISLENLSISESGIIKQQCEHGGSEWENIKSISTVEIDGQHIPTPMP